MTRPRRCLLVLATLLALGITTGQVWARAGSGGSRGSRSYSSPARPLAPSSPSMPAAPSRTFGNPMPAPQPRPGPFGGLAGALGGFVLGGLLGRLLFGGGIGPGLGLGFLDVLLIGGGLFLLLRLVQSRRREPAYAGAAGYAGAAARGWDMPASSSIAERSAVTDDIDRGLGHIRQLDPQFDAAALAADAAEAFRAVQTALAAGDLRPLRARLSAEMLAHLEGQAEALGRAGRVNRIERIQIERAEVTEAWQERGQDFVTVLLSGSLIDYTLDATGAVASGSRNPERFEDFWTFTRAVGPNAWTLTAIQTG